MKILLSAYSCEPGRGSEPGVGWNWAVQLARQGHKVWVLTRKNNEARIREFSRNESVENLNFLYHDLPPSLLWLKKCIGVHLYYELWQRTCRKVAIKADQKFDFDLIHHITFGVFRQPSYLFRINKPLVFGPVGGGEYAPKDLIAALPLKHRLKEYVRTLSNDVLVNRSALQKCFENSVLVFCKTEETENAIPQKYRSKSYVLPEIGLDANQRQETSCLDANDTFNVLYVGRLLYWKGVHLAINAFKILADKHPKVRFTIIGAGSYRKNLVKLVIENNLEGKVKFIDWLPQSELASYYSKSHLFLFPSLHDSSGNVILEAMSFGLPVVSLGIGGPKTILTNSCPTLIEYSGENEVAIIRKIGEKLCMLYENKCLMGEAKAWVTEKIGDYSWEKVVTKAYDQIDKSIQRLTKNETHYH